MSDLFTRYAPISGSTPHTYFAGANTADGFAGAYPAWIRETELDRLYIIKGGSGTGKSSMMKACASEAQRLGAEVTLLLCSSDPSSADAVILRGENGHTAAILDGTAPHTLDPSLPGAISEIVNVGIYWDADILRAHREEITAVCAEKKEAYERAYRFLGAYRHLTEVRRELLSPCVYTDKMEAAAARIAASFPQEKHAGVQTRYTYALSMNGAYHLTTFAAMAKREFRILDAYGAGEFFLRAMTRATADRRCPLLSSPSPACPDLPAELYIPGTGAYFTLADTRGEAADGVQYINMQRFLNREELAKRRARLRFTERCREMLFDGALDALSDARRCHFALEEIYKSAMDFRGVSEETERLCREIGEMLRE